MNGPRFPYPTPTWTNRVAELSSEEKREIVTLLARFHTCAEVVAHMKTEYDLELTIQQIRTYDPTKLRFEGGATLRNLFDDVRKAYVEEVATVPIANQGFRLAELQRMYSKAVVAGNRKQAADLLRQAAEEVGGVLTNERNVNMSRGAGDLTLEERRQVAVDILKKALAGSSNRTLASGASNVHEGTLVPR